MHRLGALPHLRMDGTEGEKLLGGIDGALAQRPQVRHSPRPPLCLVLSRAGRVEAAAELAGAQEVLHFAAHEDQVDVLVAVKARRNVHHGVLDVAVPLPRLHAGGDRPLRPDVQNGSADGGVHVLRGLALARLAQLQLEERCELSGVVDGDDDLSQLEGRHLRCNDFVELVQQSLSAHIQTLRP